MEVDPPNSEAEAINIKDDDLFKAAENGDVSVFKSLTQPQLLRCVSLRNEDGRSLLHVAVSSARTEVVKILSALDPSVSGINSADGEGWAPLHSAASSGNVEIVEILLSQGADVNLKNDAGRTALHYAASKGWVKVAEILLSNGAKINMKDKVGCNPLHRALNTRKSDLCELLIEEGAEIVAVDRAGQTPIMRTIICQNKEVALLLIRHGADLDVENKEGYTVLGRASNEFRPITSCCEGVERLLVPKMAPFRILSFDIECAGRNFFFPIGEIDPDIIICEGNENAMWDPGIFNFVLNLEGKVDFKGSGM